MPSEHESAGSPDRDDSIQRISERESNPWKTLDRRLVYENPWIRLREDSVIRPDGNPGIYGVVEFKNLAVGVVAIDDHGRVWMVGQYRYPLHRYSWEIPEGGCHPGETPEEAAHRELREETGLVASSLEPLCRVHLSNSVSDELAVIFRATGLSEGPSSPEGSERLEVRKLEWAEAWELLQSGGITDSMSVVGLLHEAVRRGNCV